VCHSLLHSTTYQPTTLPPHLHPSPYTVLTHCTHTLCSHTVLTHCTHTLYSHTVLTHCTHIHYRPTPPPPLTIPLITTHHSPPTTPSRSLGSTAEGDERKVAVAESPSSPLRKLQRKISREWSQSSFGSNKSGGSGGSGDGASEKLPVPQQRSPATNNRTSPFKKNRTTR
jgi:hypothetical protein